MRGTGRPRRRWRGLLACTAFVAGGLAVGDEPPATLPNAIPFEGGLADEYAKLDAANDEAWHSEAVHDQVSAQLKKLAAAAQAGLLGSEDAAALFAPDSRAAALRPDRLDEVFRSPTLLVRRGVDVSEAGTGLAISAPEAMERLLSVFDGGRPDRLHFKVFRIDPRSGESRVYVDSLGRDAERGGVLGQHGEWTIVWELSRPGGSQGGEAPPRIVRLQGETYSESEILGGGDALLTDVTTAVLGQCQGYRELLRPSLDHWGGRLDNALGFQSVGYEGMAVGDLDGDGRDDLYLCQPGGLPNQLFLQQADGTLREASAEAGVDWLDASRCALILDPDNDGDQDLAVAMTDRLLLMENSGAGELSLRSIIPLTGTAFSASAADYDNDGDLDLYVCSYGNLWGGFGDLDERFPLPYHDANNGGPNALFRNDGNWRFTNVTAEAGLDENNRRWSLACSWEDFDLDGDQDLYVANDFGRNNLYRNDGGRFTDIAAAAGVEDISPGMSVAWGDPNRDGVPDVYVSNMFSSAGNRVTFQQQFKPEADESTRGHYRRFARGNALFLGDGDGTFRDAGMDAGVAVGRWAWTSRFTDLDHDGREDIVVANGFFTQESETDL